MSFDINQLLFRLLRNWWLLLICLGLGYLSARLYLRYRDVSFVVEALVQVEEGKTQGISEEAIVMQQLGYQESQSLETQIQMLKSRQLMQTVVEQLGLTMNLYADGRVRNTNLYGISNLPIRIESAEPSSTAYGKLMTLRLLDDTLFTFGYEESIDTFRLGLPFTSPYGSYLIERDSFSSSRRDFLVEFLPVQKVARLYAQRLNVRPRAGANLLELSLIDQVPRRAQDIIERVVEVYDSTIISVKNESTNKTLAFIDDRIREFNQDLNSVEQRAENFFRDNDLLVDISTNLQRELAELRETEQTLAQLTVQLQSLNNVATYIQGGSDPYRLIPFATDLPNFNVSSLIEQYNQLLLERERLLTTASLENPAVRSIDVPLRNVRNDLLDAVTLARNELKESIAELNDRNQQVLDRVRGVPNQRRQLLSIEREQQIKEELYLFLMQKREETGLTQAITASGMRMVEPPTNDGPTGPEPLQVYLIGIAIGLFLPVGGIGVAELLDNTIKDTATIQKLTDVPVLGTVAANRRDEKIVAKPGSRTAVAEMFRMLRTNLQFLTAGKEKQTLLVTSSMSGEGKTFICINLGASFALTGKKVLLLGMDLRRPKLGQYLQGEDKTARPGLTNYLAGSATIDDLIQKVEGYDSLYYVTSGTLPPNPAELIMLDQTHAFLREMRESFDYILIDTPPVGLVTDALLLRDEVDASLYVARFNHTKQAQLKIISDIYNDGKLPKLAIILNGVNTGRGYGHGYGYGYGYGYYTKD